jgi:hypothetical protein
MLREPNSAARGHVGVGFPDRRHKLGIAEHGQRLLERLRVILL